MDTTEHLRELFYRCQFREIVRLTDAFASGPLPNDRDSYEHVILRAGALFELHELDQSRKVFERLSLQPVDRQADAILYARARLKYFQDDFLGSKQTLLDLLEGAETREYEFKALLGLAHTCIELGETQPLPAFSRALAAFEPIEKDDERIGLLTYLAKYHRGAGALETSEKYLIQVLGIAGRRGWTYCIIHALFGLAEIALQNNSAERMMGHLEVLRGLIDASEARLLAYQINRRFGAHAPVRVAIDFDPKTQRVLLQGHWLNLQQSPQIYRLLELLHFSGRPLDRREIATQLWPDQNFETLQHGKQIEELVSGARKLIEAEEVRPAILLNHDEGYQLASF